MAGAAGVMDFIVRGADRDAGGSACSLGMTANATRIAANLTEMIDGTVIDKISPMAVGTSSGADWQTASRGGDGQ